MRKIFRYFFMLGIICYFIIFYKETATAIQNDFMQPTRPCDTTKCPPSSTKPSSSNNAGLDKSNLMHLATITGSGLGKTEKINWDEIVQCDKASRKYYPRPEENVFNKEFKALYLRSCFKKLNELPKATEKIIRSHVVRLKKPKKKLGFCNAGLINNQTLITARHCLVPGNNWREKIDDSFLAEIEVTGIGKNGEDWTIRGLQILEDPIITRPPSPSSNQLKDLDYIILKPANSEKFPIDGSVTLVRDSRRKPVSLEKRLIFASYLEGRKELLTDYLISCNTVLVKRGYFNHNCQSHKRSSGAPVWIFSEDNIPKRIVGVHVGRAGYIENLNDENSGSNEAIAVPQPK